MNLLQQLLFPSNALATQIRSISTFIRARIFGQPGLEYGLKNFLGKKSYSQLGVSSDELNRCLYEAKVSTRLCKQGRKPVVSIRMWPSSSRHVPHDLVIRTRELKNSEKAYSSQIIWSISGLYRDTPMLTGAQFAPYCASPPQRHLFSLRTTGKRRALYKKSRSMQ